MIKSYRDLIVWQKSITLVEQIYSIVYRFPKNEENCLSYQIRKSVISIPSNNLPDGSQVAEGYGRKYNAEYSRFLQFARGSLYELNTQLEIVKRLQYFDNECIKTVE